MDSEKRRQQRHGGDAVGTLPRVLLLVLLLVGASAPRADPVDRLASFAKQQVRSSRAITPKRLEAFRDLQSLAEATVSEEPERRLDYWRALAVLAGTGTETPDAIASAAGDEIESLLVRDRGTELEPWLARQLGAEKSRELQRGVLRTLGPRRTPRALHGFLSAAVSEDDVLRASAVEALTGWSAPEVHAYFLRALRGEMPGAAALDRHLERVDQPLDAGSQSVLARGLFTLVASSDWRDAVRATRLISHLEAENAVPLLLEGLQLWARRADEGRGSRRVVHELVLELRRLSGRSIGANPRAWSTWWRAVREGRIELAEDMELKQGAGPSRAEFFGLAPVSDRVTFVLDRSGSMTEAMYWGDERYQNEGSRYEAAVDQVFRYLTSAGAETQFGLVLFSAVATEWRGDLAFATPRNLEAARKWLSSRKVGGGTHLREGIDLATKAQSDGSLDLDALECDTIIVLCDGATVEGAAWVRPWTAKHQAAELVFHSVLIGGGGDGTLQALAKGTGGSSVVIGR